MTTDELCQRTRTTPREIQWWHNTGVIASTATARGRDFDEDQAVVAALVAELRRKGVSLRRIRELQIGQLAGEYLVIGNWCLWCSEQDLISHVVAHPGPCLVVSVEDLKRRLHDQTTPGRSSHPRN
jgi:DNA-binding transcriptional MerR regulator